MGVDVDCGREPPGPSAYEALQADESDAACRDAIGYIARHDLRQTLRELVQRVVQERPENPLRRMADYLLAQDAAVAGEAPPLPEPAALELLRASLRDAEARFEAEAARSRSLQSSLDLATSQLQALRHSFATHMQGFSGGPGEVGEDADALRNWKQEVSQPSKAGAHPLSDLRPDSALSAGQRPTTAGESASAGGLTPRQASIGPALDTATTLMLTSHAPAVSPTMFCDWSEEDAAVEMDDVDITILKEMRTRPEVLVCVYDCLDKTANGIYACMGECNKRSMYRLLEEEPRYLYYADGDLSWAGWWIGRSLGSEDYVEWFREPSNCKFPYQCRQGELGARVAPAELSREVCRKIANVESAQERASIRQKLLEAFGAVFARLDGSDRGKLAPVANVAQTLETQQRALQVMHSKLVAETQQRLAAEAHAKSVEEAFYQLQSRIETHAAGWAGSAALLGTCDPPSTSK
eukprot:TRINITY_DN23757_c0_g2_i1.p1 TRINITY_DN23757_c0_g2~~TRINITY_DN23757_c0_g2_i1.p1  ORF type:complete len:467 (-),score=100.43 TRINITY_DN23757_c0_g2_i1:500-1900(-)